MKTVIRMLFASVIVFGGYISFTYANDAGIGNALSVNFTSLENAIQHATTGCGGAVVQTPRPGTQFLDPIGGASSSATSFFAEAARRNVTWQSTMDCTHTNHRHVLIPSASDIKNAGLTNGVNSQISDNWSGYQIGNTAQYVQTGYIVPTVVTPSPRYSTTGYDSSTWSGIGGGFGANASPLIQSGTTQKLLTDGTASYYFWYEIVGGTSDTGTEMQIGSPLAHPGDSVASVVGWLSSSRQAVLSICNFTNGGCVQFYVPNTPPPGNTVEWIVEAPAVGGYIQSLADFAAVNFYSACWTAVYVPGGSNTCYPINKPGGSTPLAINLQQNVLGGKQILAAPDVLTSTATSSSFYDYYLQPEKYPPN